MQFNGTGKARTEEIRIHRRNQNNFRQPPKILQSRFFIAQGAVL